MPRGFLRVITQLQSTGVLFVHSVPHTDSSDARCELPQLIVRFAELRETFYGAIWDVRDVIDSRNIAYTSLHLGLHMDLQCVLPSLRPPVLSYRHTGTSSCPRAIKFFTAYAIACMAAPHSS